jgi:hypothetical protein
VLSRYRALVVDAAYRPIDVVNWQRAICMDLLVRFLTFFFFAYSKPRLNADTKKHFINFILVP